MNAIVLSAIWGVVMMFCGAFVQNKSIIRTTAITGMVLLLIVHLLDFNGVHFFTIDTKNMLQFNSFSYLFTAIAIGSTLLYFLLSAKDMENVGIELAEYFALIFFITCGIALVSSFNSLLILFLGIEIISIPLYILTGSDKRNLKSNEASLKYFLMGSFSTGIMLMGMTLIYGMSGTFYVDRIAEALSFQLPAYALVGLVLLIVSLSFKVSAAPFHFWTPDVYDGAPSVFTSYMATIVKAASFIAFYRLLRIGFADTHYQWQLIIAIITALTLLIGNITAVFQLSVKRMMSYSSIAQAGFMMLAIVSMNGFGKEGLIFYAAAYSLATIGIFAVLIKMKDYTFEGFNGLAKKEPFIAAVTAIFTLSLAGIPATAGFMAKFYMLMSLVYQGGYTWLIIIAILGAVVSVYYYLRLIQAMYFKEGNAEMTPVSTGFKVTLGVLAALIILLGIKPQLLLNYLHF
ncbi:NADH-quinone oxidoreductase subunit N [Gynurincola endophyticus]|uniref:NADH-quinone oxidoreductase subunit N n=1 Tax=Gynurincola endophyticus TaxID=2479004 RepID=UPI000F8E1465|nr:NADH-quinone oxidoreductase subunit N [Gynurincola endophyticus]